MVLSARAQDGTVEAFEDDEARMVAVQWHPEETLDDLRLFADLVERARKRVHTRMTETKEEARL